MLQLWYFLSAVLVQFFYRKIKKWLYKKHNDTLCDQTSNCVEAYNTEPLKRSAKQKRKLNPNIAYVWKHVENLSLRSSGQTVIYLLSAENAILYRQIICLYTDKMVNPLSLIRTLDDSYILKYVFDFHGVYLLTKVNLTVINNLFGLYLITVLHV